jgi:hypothetical protein
MSDESCATCRFLKPDSEMTSGTGSDVHHIGMCRRFPPMLSSEALPFAVFPWVGLHTWCGEYQPKKRT